MPLPPDPTSLGPRGDRGLVNSALVWNRRLHYYLGLYLLFFTWLFVLSGLLLNHPKWQFAEFWPNRVQTTEEYEIDVLDAENQAEQSRDVMRRLGISGEVQWPAGNADPSVLAFQVSRPGLILDVKADIECGRVSVHRHALNAWGVVHLLHTFTGMRAGDTRNGRDWMLTTVWVLSMDLVALGLVVMVFSSYLMWWRLKAKRIGGVVALVTGFISCGAFLGALRWLL
jgi:hypothetical protein